MKARFLALAVAFFGLFTISSSFTPANGQFRPIYLTGNEGTPCEYGGTLRLGEFVVDGDNIATTGEILIFADGMEYTTTVDLVLDAATCNSLTLTTADGMDVEIVTGNCTINLGDVFTWNSGYNMRPGGNLNLIYNSLCSIAHLLTTNASPKAILAHINNLQRGLARVPVQE